ncbi:MAG: hypothetical protein WKF77_18880, partial [Planctomycetaceae bacterium]
CGAPFGPFGYWFLTPFPSLIANWMPFSAADLIRELCSLTLSRHLPFAAMNPRVFSKKQISNS